MERISQNLKRLVLSWVAAAGLGAFASGAGAQTVFGTNGGTFADYLPANGLNAIPFRGWATPGKFDPNPALIGANGSLIADGGSVTYAQNYASGTYTIQFDSPQPVNITTAGIIGAPNNVQRSGNHTTMTVKLTHDNGDPLAGIGWFITSGVNGGNPLSNFTMSAQGTNPSDFTPTFNQYATKYQAIRWMNNLNVNNNVAPMSASSLLPSGSNFGANSYDDVIKWANAQSNLKSVMINIPVNADSSFVAAVAKKFNALAAGKQVVVEYGNEDWNFGFSHTGWLLGQARSDARVNAGDDFGKLGQEVGLRTADMMNTFLANSTNTSRVAGFLGSQGSNTYFVDQAKSAISRVYGASTIARDFKYQGISFYPGDGLSGAATVDDLYNKLEADLTRLKSFLVADRNDANASGLSELVYEWSPNGYLTLGGVSPAVINAFRADPRSKQLTLDTWNAINSNIGANGMAFSFDITGDGWSTQINPALPAEYEQQAINQISASLSVGTGVTAPIPEPASLGLALMFGAGWLARRRRQA